MIRVGIIGCGKVADKHVCQIRRVRDSQIVGACDREELMAQQLAERFGIQKHFSDAEELLSCCRPDVIHITTPPQSHYALARQCLEAGAHVYVEKPFTLNTGEAEELIRIAEKVDRKVTVGQETQFMPVARDMRRLIQAGYLGGAPVHMESVYGYDFSDERFARAMLGNKDSWVRQLPGGLLHNIISHGIGKIVEYLQDDEVTLTADGFNSPFLEGLTETTIIDELRVIIRDRHRTTAYFTFSSQISPSLHQFRVYGPRNSLIADHEHQILIKLPGKNYKSYLNQFIPAFSFGKQYVGNGVRNIKRFLKRDFHTDSGLYYLVNSFYHRIRHNSPPPLPYRHVLLTVRIMDRIFSQLAESRTSTVAANQTPVTNR